MAENIRLREMLGVTTDFIGKAFADDSRQRAPRRVRVTSCQLFALEGGATGANALRVQTDNQVAKDQAQAEKDARAEQAANKRAEAVGKASQSAMGILRLIVERGLAFVETLRVEELKDLIIYSNPSSAAPPKGKKEELKAKVLELPTVQQSAARHHEAAVERAATAAIATTVMQVPPALPPLVPAPEAAVGSPSPPQNVSHEALDPLQSVSGSCSPADAGAELS